MGGLRFHRKLKKEAAKAGRVAVQKVKKEANKAAKHKREAAYT